MLAHAVTAVTYAVHSVAARIRGLAAEQVGTIRHGASCSETTTGTCDPAPR